MATPVGDSYTCASGGQIAAGRWVSLFGAVFTDGVPQVVSFANHFPAVAGTEQSVSVTSGTLPAGVTLDPIGKRLIYDGTAGSASVNVTLTGKPDAPKLAFENATGTIPVMSAISFPKGVVTGPLGASESNLRVVVRRTWNDGSVKHAVVCGTCDAAAVVTFNTADLGGTAMTSADIAAAAPTAVVDFGAIGSVSLASLLATPSETWISTPKMVECHYRGQFPGIHFFVEFHVRLWHDGKMWIRAHIDNGHYQILDDSGLGFQNRSVAGTVTISGTVVKTYTTAAEDVIGKCTQHIYERWVGATQYDVIPVHDVNQLSRTKLIPHYGQVTDISETWLNTLESSFSTYSINDTLMYIRSMGGGGMVNGNIALIPTWDATYAVSGDARAYRSVIAHAKAAFNYPINWRYQGRMQHPDDMPYMAAWGPSGGGDNGVTAPNGIYWEIAHHTSMGYLAYLLTGDATYADTMTGNAMACYAVTNPGHGAGSGRILYTEQTRTTGWFKRSLGQACALLPDGSPNLAPMQSWLANNVEFFCSKSIDEPLAVDSEIGYPCTVGTYNPAAPLTVAPWMFNFWIASMGMNSDIEPMEVGPMARHNALRDWMYRGIVGMVGDGSGYCFTRFNTYDIRLSDTVVPNFVVTYAKDLYQDWGVVFNNTFGAQACGNTILENGISDNLSPVGHIAQALPALTYAVDHGAPGAAAGYSRVTNATNWPTITNWSADPEWGTAPRPALAQSVRTASIAIYSEQPSAFWGNLAPGWHELTAAIALPAGMLAFSGMAVDESGGKIYSFGGGHNDSQINSVWSYDLESRSAWVELYASYPPAVPSVELINSLIDNANYPGAIIGAPSAPSLRPISRHTYKSVHWLPDHGYMAVGGGSTYSGGSGNSEYLWQVYPNDPGDWWSYSPASNAWTYRGTKWADYATRTLDPAFPISGSCMVYHEARGKIYSSTLNINNSPEIREWNPATGIWTVRAEIASGFYGQYTSIAVDTLRDRLIIVYETVGTRMGAVLAFDLTTNTWAQLSSSGAVPELFGEQYQIVYSPESDRILQIASVNGSPYGLRAYSLSTGVWTTLSFSGVDCIHLSGAMYFDKLRKVLLLVAVGSDWQSNIYAMKE